MEHCGNIIGLCKYILLLVIKMTGVAYSKTWDMIYCMKDILSEKLEGVVVLGTRWLQAADAAVGVIITTSLKLVTK